MSIFNISLNLWLLLLRRFSNSSFLLFSSRQLRWAMRPDAMEVGHPSLSLFANARSLARLFAMVAGRGTLEGRKILEPRLFARFLVPDAHGYDRVLTRYVVLNREGFELRESPAVSFEASGSDRRSFTSVKISSPEQKFSQPLAGDAIFILQFLNSGVNNLQKNWGRKNKRKIMETTVDRFYWIEWWYWNEN